MGAILVVSSSRGAGKSAVTAALVRLLGESGVSASGTKLYLEGKDDQFLSPAIAAELAVAKPPANSAEAGLKQVLGEVKSNSVLVVEGVSDKPENNLKFAEKADAGVVLVATYGEALEAEIKRYGARLRAVLVNKVPRYKAWEVAQSVGVYSDLPVPVIAVVREERLLMSPYLTAVYDAVGAEHLVGGAPSECLIENYLIGGRVLDWGISYFSTRERAAVIVAGDRPDIQLAALQTEETAAIISTKGVAPIEYVYYEARQKDIPLAVVKASTTDVAERLSEAQLDARFDAPLKLARMTDLLREQVDSSLLTELAGQPVAR